MALLLSSKEYPCLNTFIVITHFFTIVATLIIGIQLLTLSLGINLHALIDLRLLESYLTNDSTVLLGISVIVILCGSLGLLSTVQRSYAGVVTSLAILVLVLCFTDMYVIIGQRVKNYIFTNDLYNTLLNAMLDNPIENFNLHLMQSQLSCCGIHNYTDWINVINVVPGSCCGSPTICDIDDPLWNKQGCMKPIESILSYTYENTIDVIVAFNVIGIGEVFAGYFYSYLLQGSKQKNQDFYGAIPRIQQSYNLNRSQMWRQPLAYHRTSNIQTSINQVTPTMPPTIYPNLYISDTANNNNGYP